MNKKGLFSSAAVMVGLVLPAVALAGYFDVGVGYGADGSGLVSGALSTLIQRFIRFGLYIIGGLAMLVFVYSGFLYITAAGEESKVGDAKKVMMYAVVGVIVALVALVAMNTISGAISGNSLSY